MADRPHLDPAIKRIVVKVGTNTLCNPDGSPDPALLSQLAQDIHYLRSNGRQVLIISSGAIGLGRRLLGLNEQPQDVTVRQACAALGQHRLMSAWDHALRRHKVPVAQVLLTHHTFDKRRSYLHLRNCLEELLKRGAVPILNENDTVSIQEIDASFGDNDRLGALVAAKVEADLYVILSDVDGLYDRPPHVRGARRLERVEAVDDDILAMASEKAGSGARGGMRSKLHSARFLTQAGVPVAIAYGRHEGVLEALLAVDEEHRPVARPGTWFDAVGDRSNKERWLLSAHPQGGIQVDAGAAEALRDGYHLLPAGVIGVQGSFPVESVVDILHDGKVIARAVSHLSSRDLDRCQGLQSDEAKEVLGVETPANITRKGRIALLDD